MTASQDLRQRRIVAVGERRAVSGVRQEHVPQAGLARANLELLHDGRLVVGIAGLAQLALVDRFGRIDVLIHELVEALLELLAAWTGLEVHRLASPSWRLVSPSFFEGGPPEGSCVGRCATFRAATS